ncbi:hypothetical protein J6590_105818, partial [Homalodisca vitripennis]
REEEKDMIWEEKLTGRTEKVRAEEIVEIEEGNDTDFCLKMGQNDLVPSENLEDLSQLFIERKELFELVRRWKYHKKIRHRRMCHKLKQQGVAEVTGVRDVALPASKLAVIRLKK